MKNYQKVNVPAGEASHEQGFQEDKGRFAE